MIAMKRKLPPGQRESATFPRFGLTPFAKRFPRETSRIEIRISGALSGGAQEVSIPDALQGLPRTEQVSDFHCVTTWSHVALRWSGVRFSDFFEQVIRVRAQPEPEARFVMLRGQDGYRSCLPLEDLLRDDVLLADRLNGEPLSIEHGAPLRLIAPAHYGYKNVKHLSRLEFRRDNQSPHPAMFRFLDHPRARVALEERGRWFPGWMLRVLYRPLIGVNAALFARAMEEWRLRQ